MSISSKRHAKSYWTKSEWMKRAVSAEAEVERLRAATGLFHAASEHNFKTVEDVAKEMLRLRENIRALVEAGDRLIAKLERIFASEEYMAVFTCAQVHRGRVYRGENCKEEMAGWAEAKRKAQA